MCHKDRYDYSKVKFVNGKSKVIIVCKKHGNFLQLPSSHLAGRGCAKCGKEVIAKKFRKTNNKFIEDAKRVHGNRYKYDKTSYIGKRGKVIIYCKNHGYFSQDPYSHLSGTGCPLCSCSVPIDKRFLYILKDINKPYLYKIGFATNVKSRVEKVNMNNTDDNSNIIEVASFKEKGGFEKIVHGYFNQYRVTHPTAVDGKTEWFDFSKINIRTVVDYLESL
jgi:hypothetical protein